MYGSPSLLMRNNGCLLQLPAQIFDSTEKTVYKIFVQNLKHKISSFYPPPLGTKLKKVAGHGLLVSLASSQCSNVVGVSYGLCIWIVCGAPVRASGQVPSISAHGMATMYELDSPSSPQRVLWLLGQYS